ncbi:putative Uridylate kinase [Hypsibius exemplaris]|uniref:Uridylate kinase n=1 Tax=Hypsibius exemplaris TaxID=2072580 RepID=A0A1W0WA40_HYPEX|nr:putative Uridylate kinase [Hypsibius exemplaris]
MVLPKEAFNRYKKTIDLKNLKHFGLPLIFIVGKPGAGKATLCNWLRSNHDFSYVSVGQLLRDEASTNTKRGREIARYVYNVPRKLVPLELVMEMLREQLGHFLYIHKPIVIQGFPRTYQQAAAFEKEATIIKHLIYVNASDEKAFERNVWKEKFMEKAPTPRFMIEKRVRSFEKMTMPVIEALKMENRVIEIDSNDDIEAMVRDGAKAYEKWLNRSRQGAEFLQNWKSLAGAGSYDH